MPLETLGERLRRAKKERGVGNAAIAAAAGVHTKTVSRWLNDKSDPDPRELDGAARFLGVTADWLRNGDDVTAERHSPERASVERPLPRVVQSYAVRVWVKEFELELAKAGANEEQITEAIDLVRAPQVFTFYAGGAPKEFSEEEAIEAMEALATVIRSVYTKKFGLKFPR